jgi:hypothetical protein
VLPIMPVRGRWWLPALKGLVAPPCRHLPSCSGESPTSGRFRLIRASMTALMSRSRPETGAPGHNPPMGREPSEPRAVS